MKTSIKGDIKYGVLNYFANSVDSDNFVKQYIEPFMSIDDKQRGNICNILAESQKDWEAIPCDPDGPNKKQDKQLDTFIENVANRIITICE